MKDKTIRDSLWLQEWVEFLFGTISTVDVLVKNGSEAHLILIHFLINCMRQWASMCLSKL